MNSSHDVHAPTDHPPLAQLLGNLIHTPNMFHIWLMWLRELGGTYVPMRDLDEPKPRTGRRNPDTKPRTYPVGFHEKYWAEQAEKIAA